MRKTILLLFFFIKLTAQETPGHLINALRLPAELRNGIFFLKIPVRNGDTILGYCDTGGGYTAIYHPTVKKLGQLGAVKEIRIKGDTTRYIHAEDLFAGGVIPYPTIAPYFKSGISQPFLEVPNDNPETNFIRKFVQHDAFLGQFFFINHAWTFKYLTGEMFIHTPVLNSPPERNTQQLGFRKDKAGRKIFGHPRLKLEIDGEAIDFLFDTGALLLLSDSGKMKLGVDSKGIGGSFIAKSVFDQWHLEHPEWRVVLKGEITGADLIEVPAVKVGDLIAGPVWFAKRPDEAWSKGMIGSMDKVVKGAIGGSFLKYFNVTIDYQRELIQFER